MARGKSQFVETKKEAWKFKGFINYTFSAQEITEMLNYFTERTFEHSDTIMQWCDLGFKVGFSYDSFKNCYVASMTAKSTGGDLDGWIVQFRHSDVHRLLCACGFAVNELYENGRIIPPSQDSGEFGW